MLHSRGFLAEVFGILARHNISVDLITTSEVSIALTLDTTGSTSTGDTLLTQSLLIELSELCRVEVEENLALVAIIPTIVGGSLGIPAQIASFYGGTGLLIAVSVAFDLVQKIDSHLVMRNYRGLLEKG